MAKLILVRHGDTALNSRERYWGASDIKLSEDGVRQAEQLRSRLADEKIDIIYSSKLQRASHTAKIIASEHWLEVIACSELRETNFGDVEGLTFDEINRRFPDLSELWTSWSLQLKFPNGEGVRDLNVRVSMFLDRLQKHAVNETILVVAHAGPLRLLVCRLLGMELQNSRKIRIGLASISVIENFPRAVVLSLLNDHSHLDLGCS